MGVNWKEAWEAVKVVGKLAGQAAVGATRATLVDYDRDSRRMWVSELALRGVVSRQNAKPRPLGFGLELHAALAPGPNLRLDAKTRPIGTAYSLTLDAGALQLSPNFYTVACRTTARSSTAKGALKALPWLFDAMLGLGLDAPDLRVEQDVILYSNALPTQSWFVSLLRSLGGLQAQAVVPIAVVDTGLILDLSEVLAPGVLIDHAGLAARFLPATGTLARDR